MFDVENFILQVKKHQVLWDSVHPECIQRNLKQAAWENVAASMFLDWGDWSNYDKFGKVKDLQNKWKSIRDDYIKELKYRKKIAKGLTPAKKDKYKYAHLLTFLDGQEKRKSKGSDQSGTDLDESGDTKGEEETVYRKQSKLKEEISNGNLSRKSNKINQNSNKRVKRLKLAQNHISPAKHESDTSTAESDTNVQKVNKIYKRTKKNNNTSKLIGQLLDCSVELKNNQVCHNQKSSLKRHLDHLNGQKYLKDQHDQVNNQELLSTTVESSDGYPTIPKVEQDNDKMFLMSFLPHYRKFNDEQKLRARMEISKIMHEIFCENL